MSTVTIGLKFTTDQIAALDAYREMVFEKYGLRVTRSQAIRDMIGRQVREAGMEWPDDPQLGGDRRSGKADKGD